MVDFDKVDHAFESNHSFFASVEDMARFLFASATTIATRDY